MFRFSPGINRFLQRRVVAPRAVKVSVSVAEPVEASLCSGFALSFVIAGLPLGILYFRSWFAAEKLPPDSFQKLPRLSQDGSSIWSCRGSGAAWQRKTLHLRGDLRSDLVPLDRFATARIGGSWAPECEVVRLHQSSADALGMTAQAPFSCLRLADQLPQGVVTVELKPGNGLLELYGQPGLYHMQDESLLRSAEMAKGGSYSAVDIFSGRRERVLRALEALNAQGKCGDAELQVLVDERPATMAEAAELLQVTGATASAPTAAPAAAPVLAIIAQLLDGRSGQEAFSGLLPCLLRAQCAAGPALHSSCSQLNETLKSKDGAWKVSVEDMENAMKRGYWSLPPDQSGLHLREREAERLLDRAKRELWQEGSASRLELEKQIRRFLCLNLLGDAACHARLRFSFARPKTPLEQESLAELHFLQLQTARCFQGARDLVPPGTGAVAVEVAIKCRAAD